MSILQQSPSLTACQGCLLGTAIGDALGLSFEGLTRQVLEERQPDLQRYHFILGKGMVSDDTEHTCILAQALIEAQGDIASFERALARRLRHWLLLLPAGVGWATLRAGLKLWLGLMPPHSGVFSAGNAPAMRSALLGVCYGHDLPRLRQLVRVATHLTHTDPKAEYGALTVAIAAYLASEPSQVEPTVLIAQLHTALCGGGQAQPPSDAAASECLRLIAHVVGSVEEGETTLAFAQHALGLKQGVSGYVYHSVPVAIHAWLSYPNDFEQAVQTVILCGGDTDTVAAITGALVGTRVGVDGLPKQLLDNLYEYPRSVSWMQKLGVSLHHSCTQKTPQPVPEVFWGSVLVRNLGFLVVVLLHGFNRLLNAARRMFTFTTAK